MKKLTGCLSVTVLAILSLALLLAFIATVLIKSMEYMAYRNTSSLNLETSEEEELKPTENEEKKLKSFPIQTLTDVPFSVTIKTSNGMKVNTITWNGIYNIVNDLSLTKIHGGNGKFVDISALQILNATVLLYPHIEYYQGIFPFAVFSEDGWMFLSSSGIVAYPSELGYSVKETEDGKNLTVYAMSGEEPVD